MMQTALEIGNWKIKSEEVPSPSGTSKVNLKFSYNDTQDITFASFNAILNVGTDPSSRMIAVTRGSELSGLTVTPEVPLLFKYKFPNGKVDDSAATDKLLE